MFDAPFAARRRPMFGVSAALHAALLLGLVVPPLLATPEPPEPDGFVRIESVPRLASNAPVVEKVVFLRRGNEGRATAPAQRASNQPRGARAPLTQPHGASELLPAPTGEEAELAFEESSGERSEPGSSESGRRDGADGGGGEGCEGCKILPANAPGVTPPIALDTPSPSYPELARRARVEGVVMLEAIIGADGFVRDVRILRSANVLLEAPALEAVRRWRYRAAKVEGRGVPVYLTVVVTFSLR